MTAVGGMLLLGHASGGSTSIVPDSPAHWFGAFATVLSFINIFGGFLVSGKMLDLFRRPTDPEDYFALYAIPSLLLVGGLGASAFGGVGDLSIMAGVVAVVSAICCISGIAGLANQESARTGNVLGMSGVAMGLAATTAEMSATGAGPIAFEQVGVLGGAGALVGGVLASGVGPTELPQTVAAFHSLVGLAAMAGAAGEFLGSSDLGTGTLSAIYLATLIGGVTFSGSIVAFGKLAGMMKSSPLQLPGRDQLNLGMLGACALGMSAFLNPGLLESISMMDPSSIQTGSLGLVAVVSSLLGWHLTASIGGKSAHLPCVALHLLMGFI